MGTHLIKGLNPLLQYVADLMSVFQIKPIAEPQKYRDKVLAAKDVLKHDVSGLVNTVLDFAMSAASAVQYRVSSPDKDLNLALNTWLLNINEDLRGHVPTGVNALAKEYFRERWKGSSHLLLRTFWETKDGITLPTSMFFVDGEDIVCKNAEDPTIRLGEEKYALRLSADDKEDIPLPKDKNEEIYVQMPYESWGTRETRPFLMRRGLWHNLIFMKLLSEKGEFVVARALEYLFLIKKGTEKLFIEGNISYSRDDLEKVSKDFQELLAKKKYEIPVINGLPTGAPTYATQFDTSMEHLIPDYSKIINEQLFITIERRILAGLGLIDVLEGIVSSSKRVPTMNSRPFVSEVRQAVNDYKSLLGDIMREIAVRNKKKWKDSVITITVSPIPQFIDDDGRNLLRSLYDRGVLSRETLIDIVGELDFDTEITRLKDEKKSKIDEVMFPPVIQNLGEQATGPGNPMSVKEPADKNNKNIDKVPNDKKGIEKRNYNKASEDVVCALCEYSFDWSSLPETQPGLTECPRCSWYVNQQGEVFNPSEPAPFQKETMTKQTQSEDVTNHENEAPLPGPNFTRDETNILSAPVPPESVADFETAPYRRNEDLPPAVRKYPSGAQTAFRKAWMNAYRQYKDEQQAFKVAWSVLNKQSKKE